MKYEIEITALAQADLKGIAAYISQELQEPETARKLIGRLRKAVFSLEELPKRHAIVSDEYLAAKGVRCILQDQYLIFYVVDEPRQLVQILRVLYARRDWKQLL